jgi:lipoate-protein ligase A
VESVIRLLPYADADGATNMAADEALVRAAAECVASLRFYGWTTATVSLGYFQPRAVRLTNSNLANLPWVRRTSGGATLVHHHELTYALALPAGAPWHSGESWLLRMHRVITAALEDLGLLGKIELVGQHPIKHGDVLCFQQHTVGDVLCAGHKIVGSAQRKHRLALLQHGSILLAQSEHAPALPGIRETVGVTLNCEQVQSGIERAFTVQTGWRLEPGVWNEHELQTINELRREKYATAAWNERR